MNSKEVKYKLKHISLPSLDLICTLSNLDIIYFWHGIDTTTDIFYLNIRLYK